MLLWFLGRRDTKCLLDEMGHRARITPLPANTESRLYAHDFGRQSVAVPASGLIRYGDSGGGRGNRNSLCLVSGGLVAVKVPCPNSERSQGQERGISKCRRSLRASEFRRFLQIREDAAELSSSLSLGPRLGWRGDGGGGGVLVERPGRHVGSFYIAKCDGTKRGSPVDSAVDERCRIRAGQAWGGKG